MNNTYRNSKGKYQSYVCELRKLIPHKGNIPDKFSNPQLELFRIYSNLYNSLYRDNLNGNHEKFIELFKIVPGHYVYRRMYLESFYMHIEEVMNKIIFLAAQEQGMVGKIECIFDIRK